jgi:hypothetical protein
MIRPFRISKEGSSSQRTTIRTDNPRRKIWEYLRRFQNTDYTTRRLQTDVPNLKPDSLAMKAEHIALAISQAEAYYQSAEVSMLRIRPLLLYYGMLNLSKALILSGDNQYTLESSPINEEHASHALSIAPLKTNSSDRPARNADTILDEFCYSKNRGLFALLHRCYSDQAIPRDTKFTVKQLLSVLPEDWQKYRDYFHEPPNLELVWADYDRHVIRDIPAMKTEATAIGPFDYYQVLDFAGPLSGRIHEVSADENIADFAKRLFPELGTNKYINYAPGGGRFFSSTPPTTIDDCIVVSHDLFGQPYGIMSPFAFRINDIDIHFLLMFILGNLVRYVPNKWSKIATFTATDELFLLEGFIETSAVKYPNLILNELEGRRFSFVTGEKHPDILYTG